ncbi:hypothetical protein LMG26296_04958 [Cupriavidus plantarum]|nr:hypothetical protein LMG26296_04958 [Cupriavidus plantarum]
MVCGAPGVYGAHGRPVEPVPLSHRRGTGTAEDADRARAAAVRRERVQSAGGVHGQGGRHVAVHPEHGQDVQPQAEHVPRRAARRARVHGRGARLPRAALRHVRRLASGARRVQLGGGRGLARDRAQSGPRAAHGLCQPDDAERDALLRAQAAGGEEHHRQPGRVWREAARYSRSSVLRHGDDVARHRRGAGREAREHADRGIQGAEPVVQQARDPGRRESADPAAVR